MGTNHYDFYLATRLIVDEWGEGVPVAWLVSNHETTAVLVEFLRAPRMHGRLGEAPESPQKRSPHCLVDMVPMHNAVETECFVHLAHHVLHIL